MAIETTDLFVLQKNGGELRKASFKDIQDEVIDNIADPVRVAITATAGQTVFDVSPAEIVSGTEFVYLNGTLLSSGSDYTTTSDTITLLTAAVEDDILEVISGGEITGERQYQNLGYNESKTQGKVTISDGTNATIPAASSTRAGLLTASKLDKLDAIEDGAEANIQSDWNALPSSGAYIINKPATVVERIVAGNGVSVTNGGIGEVTVTSTADQLEFGGSTDVTSSTVPSATFNAVPLAIADFYINVGLGKFSTEWAAVTDNATTATDANPGDYLVYNGSTFEHIPSGTPPGADGLWVAASGKLEPVDKSNQVIIGNTTTALSLDVVGRARSTPTKDSDGANTLTTKGYVLGKIPTVGEGTLTINLPDGSTPTFGANQTGNTEITIPEPFSGDYDDVTNKPTIGAGILTVNLPDGSTPTFGANQTGNTEITIPAPFSGNYNDLSNKPTIGKGTLTVNLPDGTSPTFGANQSTNTSIDIPAPFSGNYNDLTNKPTIGKGTLTVNLPDGSTPTFGANQTGNTEITIPEPFSGDYDDLTNKPTIGAGTLTIKDSNGDQLGTFGANQTGPTTIDLPDVTPENINYTHPGSGAIERTLQSRLEDYVSVKDFGAVGDGVTNDSDAINAALDWWSSAAARHLHFPGGAYSYPGSKTVDCEHRYGNKLTMDGYIIAGTEDKKSFTFRRLSDGYIQMFVWGGGSEGAFNLADPPTGSTFLQVEAAHNTEFYIRSVDYAGRALRMTHLNGPNQDDSNGSNRCIFNKTYVTGKGRLEGRVGQQFYCDAGTNVQKGAFGMLTWIGDGYEYGSVFDDLKDITIPYIEAGAFNADKAGAALEFRGLMNVHCGDIYLGESWGYGSNSISLGQPGKQYKDCMLSNNQPDYNKVLFYIGGEGTGRSRNIYIDKYNALVGGVGLNIEKTYSPNTGIIISQMNSAGCGVGLNLNDIDGDVYIGALSGIDNGMLVNKYGATSGQTPLIDINVIKMGEILFNGQNKDDSGNPLANDPVKPAIMSFFHHGLFKITGNFEDKEEGIKENQPLIEIADDGDEYYLISNARFSTVKGDGSVANGSSAIKIYNPSNPSNSNNKVRVTDCIFMPGTEPMGSHLPSYARGCVGLNDTA